MNIGFDAKRALHNQRGLGNYARNLLEALHQEAPKHHYFLYSPRPKSQWSKEWLSTYPKFHIKTPTSWLSKNCPSLWRSFLTYQPHLKKTLDIYHGLSHELPLFAKKSRYKKVVTIHDVIPFRFPHFFPRIDRQLYRLKMQYACRIADHIIAISKETKYDLIRYLLVPENKISVCYQSCHSSFYKCASSQKKKSLLDKYKLNKPFILHVGALEERKNILNSLQAFKQAHLDSDFVLIGNGSTRYIEKIQTLAKSLDIEKNIRLFHKVTLEELPTFYQCARIFCFPSFFEGFGIPLLEALFSKTPVLTSNLPVFKEISGPRTEYVNPHSISEITCAMTKLWHKTSQDSQILSAERKCMERFHYQSTTKQLLTLYHNL